MYGDGKAEGTYPAASQPNEAGERGYLKTPSAGDSVARNPETVKRDKLALKYCEAYGGCYGREDMSAYLTPGDMEQIVEHLDVSMKE